MTDNLLKPEGISSGKILDSIKNNPFLPLILILLIIEIIVYNVVFEGNWIYRDGYGPMSLQDARDLSGLIIYGNHKSSWHEMLGGQALGASINTLMLMITVPTAICLLFRWRTLSILGVIALGLNNLWQLNEYFSDMKKVSETYVMLLFISIVTLCLTIMLYTRVLKYKKAPKATTAATGFLLIAGMTSLASCSGGQEDSNYIYYPIKYQGHKAYMSADGTISAMSQDNIVVDEAFRYIDGGYLATGGKNLRIGMKDAVVIHNFWDGGQTVVKPRKGENEVELLFSTEDTDMGDFSEGRVPVSFQDYKEGNHRLRIMDTDGNIVAEIEDINGDKLARSARIFRDGLLRVKTLSGKTAYLDRDGNVAIAPRDYFKADNFYNGHALVAEARDKWSLIDTKGETIYRFDEGAKASHLLTPGGVFFVKNGTIYYDDLKGNRYKQPESRDIVDTRDSYYVYKHDDGFGISNYKGEILLAPTDVQRMLPASESSVVVRREDGKTELLSLSGESIKDLGQSEGIYLIPSIYGHTNDFGFWLERGGDLYYYTQEGEQPLAEPVEPLINSYDFYMEDILIRRR